MGVAAVVAVGASAAALGLGARDRGDAATVATVATLPACAHARAPVALPAGLRAFPLPRGTVIDGRSRKYGYTFFSGHVPGAINPTRDFLLATVPRGGYRIGTGDSEAAEAEAAFTGHGLRGKYKVNAVAACPGALNLQIAVRTTHA